MRHSVHGPPVIIRDFDHVDDRELISFVGSEIALWNSQEPVERILCQGVLIPFQGLR